MTDDLIITIGTEAVKVMIYLAGPLLVAAMSVGLLVSLFQAVTQINEATLTFIPKILAVIAVLAIMSPWMIEVMKTYTHEMLGGVGSMIR